MFFGVIDGVAYRDHIPDGIGSSSYAAELEEDAAELKAEISALKKELKAVIPETYDRLAIAFDESDRAWQYGRPNLGKVRKLSDKYVKLNCQIRAKQKMLAKIKDELKQL